MKKRKKAYLPIAASALALGCAGTAIIAPSVLYADAENTEGGIIVYTNSKDVTIRITSETNTDFGRAYFIEGLDNPTILGQLFTWFNGISYTVQMQEWGEDETEREIYIARIIYHDNFDVLFDEELDYIKDGKLYLKDMRSFDVEKVTVRRDTAAPKVSSCVLSDERYITVEAEDNEGGSGVVEYCVDDRWSSSPKFYLNRGGKHTAMVKDAVGNVSAPYEFEVDLEAPVFDDSKEVVEGIGDGYMSLKNKMLYNSARIKVQATDDVTADSELLYSMNNKDWTPASEFEGFIVNENGSYNVYVKDSSGKVSKKSIDVDIINSAPSIQIENTEEISRWGARDGFSIVFRVNDDCRIDLDDIESFLEVDAGELNKTVRVDKDKIIVTVFAPDDVKNCKHTVVITASDAHGRAVTKSVEAKLDLTPPIITGIDEEDGVWSNGDYVFSVSAEDEEEGSGLDGLYILDNKGDLLTMSKTQGGVLECVLNGRTISVAKKDGKYVVTVPHKDGEVFDETLNFRIRDNAKNLSEIGSKKIKIDCSKPVLESVTYKVFDNERKEFKSGKFVKEGDKIIIEAIVSDSGSGITADKMKVYLDKAQNISIVLDRSENKEKTLFSGLFVVDPEALKLKDNDLITIESVELSDDAGNTIEENGTTDKLMSNIFYYESFDYEKMNFEYYVDGAENKKIAVDDKEIVVEFTSTHKVNIPSENTCFMLADKMLDVKWTREKLPGGVYKYRGAVLVDHSPEYDNCEIVSCFEINDDAGNAINLDFTGKIKYYAPIDPSGITFVSDNEKSELYARDNSKLTVSFSTTHPVSIAKTELAGNPITFESEDGMNWIGTLDLGDETISRSELSDEKEISFFVTLEDEANNPEVTISEENAEKVIYLEPIEITDLSMRSNNESGDAAKAKSGDEITVSFKANHPLDLTEAVIGTQNVSFESEKEDDGMRYHTVITAEDGVASDMDIIAFALNADDIASNDRVSLSDKESLSEDEKIRYYESIKISELSIVSDNENSGEKYAKNGDIITVEFEANHDIEISDAVVAGHAPDVEMITLEGVRRKYQLTYTMNSGDIDDQKRVDFKFTVNDAAKNAPVSMDNDSVDEMNEIIYYSPITTDVSIRSGGLHSEYVNNGGRVIISGAANHNVRPVDATVLGDGVSIIGGSSESYTLTRSIGENESANAEGTVSFAYKLIDNAGNTLNIDSTTDGSYVTYDRTLPTVKAEYTSNSFTNEPVTFVITFSDSHLSPSDLSVKLNGIEQISESERYSFSGDTFIKTLTIDTDNNYHLTASAKDMAGNSTQPNVDARITYDNTLPTIKPQNIKIDKPEVYKSEFNIKDHFNVEDNNLKEVICTVTNSLGTFDCGLNDIITVDGKNTIYIVATDMADNVSESVTYDFYIDATPPKPVISDELSGKFLDSADLNVFSLGVDLRIGLEKLNIDGVSVPDKFTTLYIADGDGNIITDLLERGSDANGIYSLALNTAGTFFLYAEAVDSVENTTGMMKYDLKIEDKTVIEKVKDNKVAATGIVSGGIIGLLAAGYIFIFRRRSRR